MKRFIEWVKLSFAVLIVLGVLVGAWFLNAVRICV